MIIILSLDILELDLVGRPQTVNTASSFGVVVSLEIFFLGLGLTATEINIKKVQKPDLKM